MGADMIAFSLLLASAAVADAANAPAPTAPPSEEVVVTGQRSEGSDDYGVAQQRTATRLPLSQKDTPQSVSVVTRAQIDDFQLNSVNDLLNTVPGVSVLAAETDRFYYSARGFEITTFQIDGIGQPFSFGIQTGSIDTAIYDRIEVVRGAPGLLSPTGNPSAVVDYIRKRPYRDLRATASAQYGSFNAKRIDADISVPLTKDGSIRARGVGVYNDTGSYLDRYQLRRWTGYGIVEADLGPNTVVSAGYGYQNHQSHYAQWGAIPLLYGDGTRLTFPRDSNTGPGWAGWNVVDRQIFGDLTHDFGGGWTAKMSVLRRAIDERDQLFYVYGNPSRTAPGGIDAATGEGVFAYPGKFNGPTRNLTLDAYVSGKVTVGGRAHDVMFGVQRGAERYRQFASYDTSTIGTAIPLDTLFSGIFPQPDFPAFSTTPSLDRHTRRETAYGLVRLDLADPLKLMLGGQYTHATSEGTSYGTAQDYAKSRFLPFVGATLALTPAINAYASYTAIFNPQVETDADNRILAPIEGNNIEAGLKGQWFDGRLYASAALFRARQDHTAQQTGVNTATLQAIYAGVDARSEGVELEFGGRLLPGLQATGGLTFLRLKNLADGTAARTFVPRDLGRLNLVYTPPALPAAKLGVSVQYQSRIYYDTTTVTKVAARITQGGYATTDLFAAYDLNRHVRLSVNARNIGNVKYLSSLTFEQSYYGAPRAVLGTVALRY